jgi:hypothetical protein
MTKVTCDIAISVDGFAAGPNQRFDEPFGDGIDGRLHRWMLEEPEAHIELERFYLGGTDLVTHLHYRVAH